MNHAPYLPQEHSIVDIKYANLLNLKPSCHSLKRIPFYWHPINLNNPSVRGGAYCCVLVASGRGSNVFVMRNRKYSSLYEYTYLCKCRHGSLVTEIANLVLIFCQCDTYYCVKLKAKWVVSLPLLSTTLAHA